MKEEFKSIKEFCRYVYTLNISGMQKAKLIEKASMIGHESITKCQEIINKDYEQH